LDKSREVRERRYCRGESEDEAMWQEWASRTRREPLNTDCINRMNKMKGVKRK
jgi:hypothetical protein